jgi:hypothetical protein
MTRAYLTLVWSVHTPSLTLTMSEQDRDGANTRRRSHVVDVQPIVICCSTLKQCTVSVRQEPSHLRSAVLPNRRPLPRYSLDVLHSFLILLPSRRVTRNLFEPSHSSLPPPLSHLAATIIVLRCHFSSSISWEARPSDRRQDANLPKLSSEPACAVGQTRSW